MESDTDRRLGMGGLVKRLAFLPDILKEPREGVLSAGSSSRLSGFGLPKYFSFSVQKNILI